MKDPSEVMELASDIMYQVKALECVINNSINVIEIQLAESQLEEIEYYIKQVPKMVREKDVRKFMLSKITTTCNANNPNAMSMWPLDVVNWGPVVTMAVNRLNTVTYDGMTFYLLDQILSEKYLITTLAE